MELLTIRQTAKRGPLNECALRRMVAQGVVPGFRHGNRFLVNYALLLEQLERESRNATQTQAAATQ